MKGTRRLAIIGLSIWAALAAPAAHAESDSLLEKEVTNSSAALVLGACVFNQSLGVQPIVGIHGDYKFLHWLGAGLFVDYAPLGSNVPGQPNVSAISNGSFYIGALELNLFPAGFLTGLSLGPSFGFSTYNSPPTPTFGSYNSIYLTYGLHIGYDVPIVGGLSVGGLVSDMVINSGADLGFNVNELNLGAVVKFWF